MYNQKPLLGTLPNYAHPLTPNVGAWLFNEGSGNKAFDIIGGNHGILGAGAAAPSWIPEGLSFDGGDYIEVSSLANRNWINGFTIRAITKPSSVTGNHDILGSYTWAADKGGFRLVQEDAYLSFFLVWDGSQSASYISGLVTNKEYDIVAVWDKKNINLYVNGILKDSDAKSPTNLLSDNSIYIGKRGDGATNYFNGIIKYATILNYAITAPQVTQLYYDSFCWLAQPMGMELMYAAPPVGAIINQFQKANLGADLYDGVLIT